MLVNSVIQISNLVKPSVVFRAAPNKTQQCGDSFEKSGDKKIEKGNLIDGLEKSGFNKKDAVFLTSLTMGALIAKFGIDYAKEVMMNKTDLVIDGAQKSVKANDFQIDGDDGIFKISGTPINIDPKRFTKIDLENGILANEEKGILYNLREQKIIDNEAGIFIDPSKNLSFMKLDGLYQNVPIPSFQGNSFGPFLSLDGANPPDMVQGSFFGALKHKTAKMWELLAGGKNIKDIAGNDIQTNVRGDLTNLASYPYGLTKEEFIGYINTSNPELTQLFFRGAAQHLDEAPQTVVNIIQNLVENPDDINNLSDFDLKNLAEHIGLSSDYNEILTNLNNTEINDPEAYQGILKLMKKAKDEILR